MPRGKRVAFGGLCLISPKSFLDRVSTPEEYHVYSLTTPIHVRSSGAPCALARFRLHAAPMERDRLGNLGL